MFCRVALGTQIVEPVLRGSAMLSLPDQVCHLIGGPAEPEVCFEDLLSFSAIFKGQREIVVR